ncbi:hypothetical protein BRD00_05100 [Halobacteriales archaeon QS_8_69_26]|nr:MAG: hypothetical protein BRD00_05100 [Halobacteriales archaeon QS_8_69_26]
MSDEPPSITVAFLRASRVLFVFGGITVVGIVALAPALAPVYFGFQYGQTAEFEQYREVLALGGILVGSIVAVFFTRPVFAYGTEFVGKRT